MEINNLGTAGIIFIALRLKYSLHGSDQIFNRFYHVLAPDNSWKICEHHFPLCRATIDALTGGRWDVWSMRWSLDSLLFTQGILLKPTAGFLIPTIPFSLNLALGNSPRLVDSHRQPSASFRDSYRQAKLFVAHIQSNVAPRILFAMILAARSRFKVGCVGSSSDQGAPLVFWPWLESCSE